MKHECIRVEEVVWECARSGNPMPPEVIAHARKCSECSEIVARTRDIFEALHCAGDVPMEPDCRPVIMERLTQKASVLRMSYAWTAMCVVLLVGVGLFLSVSHSRAPHSPTVVVKRNERKLMPPNKTPAVAPDKIATDPSGKAQDVAMDTAPPEKRQDRAEPAGRKHNPVRRTTEQKQIALRQPSVAKHEKSEQNVTEPEAAPQPVALVVVTWIAPEQDREEVSECKYTDSEGATSESRVKQTDKSIEIHFEQSSQIKTKGGVDNGKANTSV